MPNSILLEPQKPAASSGDPAHLQFPGSALARFFELRGRRIIRACGAVWYTIPDRFLMSLPYQAMLNPEPSELRRLIRETHTFGARFPSMEWDGLESGIYVMRRREYEIDSVHAKHRPRVRHGMQTFKVKLATAAELRAQGLQLNRSTMARQGRYDPEFGQRAKWETLVEAVFACSEVSVPAVFAGPRMAAYMITCREHGWLHILHQMSRQEDLPNFPNHLLTYTVTKQAVADDSLEAISYGYVPLFAADGLHEYKLRFGYDLIPHRSAIQLHPAVGPVLSSLLGPLGSIRKLNPEDQRLKTIETVLKGARCSRPPEKSC
jgi:hypothetical protein